MSEKGKNWREELLCDIAMRFMAMNRLDLLTDLEKQICTLLVDNYYLVVREDNTLMNVTGANK